MTSAHPNPASAERQADERTETVNKEGRTSQDDFTPKGDLPGKVDSGPEPDVFGREIPPQE